MPKASTGVTAASFKNRDEARETGCTGTPEAPPPTPTTATSPTPATDPTPTSLGRGAARPKRGTEAARPAYTASKGRVKESAARGTAVRPPTEARTLTRCGAGTFLPSAAQKTAKTAPVGAAGEGSRDKKGADTPSRA